MSHESETPTSTIRHNNDENTIIDRLGSIKGIKKQKTKSSW